MKQKEIKYIFLFSLLFLLICSCDKGKSSSAPAGPASSGGFSLEILPPEAKGDSVLRLAPHGFDISEAAVELLKNGIVIPNTDPGQLDLPQAEVKKGSAIQAKATLQGEEIWSNVVNVRNTPPVITGARILPEVFKHGDRFSVEVTGKDFDEDQVSFLYDWTLNGSPAGSNSSIDSQIKRGDKVTVKIIPFDGEDYGDPLVLDREIRNMPPEITEHNELNVTGNTYAYQVKASDADGDPLSYTLESPAPGMTMDAKSGLLTWTAPPDFKGKQTATVAVNDGKGGVARYTFSIVVQ